MTSMTDIANECHQTAIDKGWHLEPREFGTMIALVHSELSEALEEARNEPDEKRWGDTYYEETRNGNKPCGIPSELADAVIRIFDLAGSLGIDIEASVREKMDYNSGRSHRHGGKSF